MASAVAAFSTVHRLQAASVAMVHGCSRVFDARLQQQRWCWVQTDAIAPFLNQLSSTESSTQALHSLAWDA